ncbi:hypothetical protein, partial [Gluconobacter kondonii]
EKPSPTQGSPSKSNNKTLSSEPSLGKAAKTPEQETQNEVEDISFSFSPLRRLRVGVACIGG